MDTSPFVRVRHLIAAGLLVAGMGILVTGCTTSSGGSAFTGSSSKAAQGAVPPSGQGNQGPLSVVSFLPAPANTRNGADQLISENDLLEIDVFQVDELDRTIRVDSNGRISLPLIGIVEAAGQTVPDLETSLERKYGSNYLQSPEIAIFVKEAAGQKVTMDGEFIRPGIYPTTSKTTLLQAVAQAGGLSSIADEASIYIFRQVGAQKLVAKYSIQNIRLGKSPDPRIFGGDIIVSFTSGSKIALQTLKEALGVATSATRLVTPL